MKSALTEFVRYTLRPYCGWRLSWRPGDMTISKIHSPPLKHALPGVTKSQQKSTCWEVVQNGLYKCWQGIQEKWSKHPQGFREGFSEVVAHERKSSNLPNRQGRHKTSRKGKGVGKRTETPVVRTGICLWLLGMWTRTGSWKWRRGPRSVGGAQLTPPGLWKAIRVAQGWGQEEGCPSLLCGWASSPVPWKAAPREREWAEQVPALPPCDSSLALGALLCAEKPGAAMGSFWEARPGPGQGLLYPPFSTQRLGQAAAEPCWGSGMPSDRGVRFMSIEAHWGLRSTATRWENWVLLKEGTSWSHTVRWE